MTGAKTRKPRQDKWLHFIGMRQLDAEHRQVVALCPNLNMAISIANYAERLVKRHNRQKGSAK